MQLELNYTWIQELLEKIRIKVSVSNLDNYQELLFLEFKHYIHDALHNKLGSKEGKEPKWNLDEFLTLCVIFHIEEVLSKLKIQEIQEINEEKYHIRKYRNTYILNLKPSENLNKYKNWLPNFKDLKIEGVESYYEANQRLLKSLLKQKSINHSLTPFQWIALVRNAFFCDSTKKYIMAEKSLNVSSKIKRLIFYHHYKLDARKATRGIFPVEIYSLKEALNFLRYSQNNLLAKCFTNNIGFYCKTSSFEIKKDSNGSFSSLDDTEPSYIYFFEGLERLHKKEPIRNYFEASIFPLRGDSPTKILCKSEIIHAKLGSSSLVVPVQLSLADICQGITEKSFILKPGQQITPDDVYFLKSDIEELKGKYFAKDDQEQLINPTHQDIEIGRKTREKNKKFAQVASKRKKEKANQRWKESLDCALSIARDNPNHYFATDLARSVAKRKSIPGKLDTLRKKILKDKDIVKYLRQMKEVA